MALPAASEYKDDPIPTDIGASGRPRTRGRQPEVKAPPPAAPAPRRHDELKGLAKDRAELFEKFMADCAGKRGMKNPTDWISPESDTTDYKTDKGFLDTWEKVVDATYKVSINEALWHADSIVKTRKITLLEQMRKHRGVFLVLVFIKWCQNERASSDNAWKQQHIYRQEAVDLTVICKYYSDLK